MPLARQIYNPGGRGQNARFDVRGLQRTADGYLTDGTYTYDDNGLSAGPNSRPDAFIQGLKPADAMDDDQWGDYLQGRDLSNPKPQAAPPTAAPRSTVTNPLDVNAVPTNGTPRVLDAQNPKAIAYAQRRLAQLRALGIEVPDDPEDPTAAWRELSRNVLGQAQAAGFANPRDWLAGNIPTVRPQRESGGPAPMDVPQHPVNVPRPPLMGEETLVPHVPPMGPTSPVGVGPNRAGLLNGPGVITRPRPVTPLDIVARILQSQRPEPIIKPRVRTPVKKRGKPARNAR